MGCTPQIIKCDKMIYKKKHLKIFSLNIHEKTCHVKYFLRVDINKKKLLKKTYIRAKCQGHIDKQKKKLTRLTFFFFFFYARVSIILF